MIASLRGRVLSKDLGNVVIDCGGVGYGVTMSLSSASKLGAEGSEARLHIHTHVAQDVLRLYGFVDLEEKQAFEVLIATTGVGPKLALAVLSALSPGELAAAVADSDKARLTHIPGVGNKTAERLLVELKDRLKVSATSPRGIRLPGHPLLSDLASALSNLGFKDVIADDTARLVLAEHPEEKDLAALVRLALRASTRV